VLTGLRILLAGALSAVAGASPAQLDAFPSIQVLDLRRTSISPFQLPALQRLAGRLRSLQLTYLERVGRPHEYFAQLEVPLQHATRHRLLSSFMCPCAVPHLPAAGMVHGCRPLAAAACPADVQPQDCCFCELTHKMLCPSTSMRRPSPAASSCPTATWRGSAC
jgi:hypothetical protein